MPPAQAIPIGRWLDTLEGRPAVPMPTADEAAYDSVVMSAMYDAAKAKVWVDVKNVIWPEPEAREMYRAVNDPQTGVLPRLRKYW